MTIEDDGNQYARRAHLVAAADDTALKALVLDSIDVASAAIEELSDTLVPRGLTDGLRAQPVGVGELAATAAAAQMFSLVEPYQPEEEPEDRDDRTKVLEFAASVIYLAFDTSREPRERAGDAAWTLADLYAHLDVFASDEFAEEGVGHDLRPDVTEGGEAYDDFCMRRQNELLELLAAGADPAGRDVRASTDQGRDVLRRALDSLIAAGRF